MTHCTDASNSQRRSMVSIPSQPGGMAHVNKGKRVRLSFGQRRFEFVDRFLPLKRGVQAKARGWFQTDGVAEEYGFHLLQRNVSRSRGTQDLSEVLMDRRVVVDNKNAVRRRRTRHA
jgi:hypothetical protein